MKKILLFITLCIALTIVWTACVKDTNPYDTQKAVISNSTDLQGEVADRTCSKAITISGAQNFSVCGNLTTYGDDCNICPPGGHAYGKYVIDNASPVTLTMINYEFSLKNNNATSKIVSFKIGATCPTVNVSFAAGVTKTFTMNTSTGGCCVVGEAFCE